MKKTKIYIRVISYKIKLKKNYIDESSIPSTEKNVWYQLMKHVIHDMFSFTNKYKTMELELFSQ